LFYNRNNGTNETSNVRLHRLRMPQT